MDEKGKINRNARALSKLGASKGGKARAAVLTPDERKEIAQKAIRTRWAKAKGIPLEEVGQVLTPPAESSIMPKVGEMPISLFQGTLQIGDVEFSCHVLDNYKRVIAQREVVRSLTGKVSGDLKSYLGTTAISKYIDLAEITDRTISFRIPATQYEARGYEATLLVEICDAYLKAREVGGLLVPSQLKLAKQAEIIIRACAKVGIIALIDEATGFQKVRADNALRLKLQAFIAEDLQEWVRMFPQEFFIELARLENVHYSPRNRPIRWGKYVLAFVYAAVDKDVARELKRRIPNPHYGQNLHQLLRDFGKEKVNAQLYQVLGIMKTCRDMDEFRRKFDYVFKKEPYQLTFLDFVDSYQLN
ncbi:MAG: P63C domain-containing protein [Dehalococcoidia bacterium]|nr:P63C domain-containing protein [Dehalococcoidia bacterium]